MAQWTSSDTFAGRTVSSNTTGSLGTASDGETWSCVQGTGSPNTFAVSSGEGQISESSGTGIVFMKLGSNSGTDMETSCRIAAGTSGDTIYVFVRLTDSTHYYRLSVQTGSTSAAIGMKNGGSFVTLTNGNNLGFTITTGVFYWFRFRVIGTNLYGKVWRDGTDTEPITWNSIVTDSSIASGGPGLGCNPQGTAACQFDTFNAFTIDASLSDTTSLAGETLSYKTIVLNDSPIRYYRLGDTTGTTAVDSSTNASNGTLHGGVTLAQAGAIAGSEDTAMLFNGSTGYISIPQTGLPTGSSNWSIEAWVNPNTIPAGPGAIINFGTYTSHSMAALQVTSSAQIRLSTYSGDITTANNYISTGKWYHCAGTYDGTSTRLYVNGQYITSGTFSLNVALAFASIGAGSTGPQDYLNGTVDEVAIYNTVLTYAQIQNHYLANAAFHDTLSGTGGTTSFPADSAPLTDAPTWTGQANSTDNLNGYRATILGDNPRAYYRLNESSGTTAFDATPNALNGTLSATGITLAQAGGIVGDTDAAMTFNGVSFSSQITLPQTSLPTGASPWSVECWCMRPSYPSGGGYTFAAGFGTYSTHAMANIGFHWVSSTVGHTILSTYGGDLESGPINIGQWYHIVGTYDGTAARLYTNGSLTSTLTETMNMALTFANIGAGQGTDRFTGSIDEVAFYNFALTQAQVTAHYTAGATITDETLSDTVAGTLTDSNSLADAISRTIAQTLTDSSTVDDSASTLTDQFKPTDQLNGVQNLTLYYLSATTTTLPTATGLATLTGGVLGASAQTTVGTSTGFGELYAQNYTGVWPSLGALGSPSGNGYLWDSTAMEGMTLLLRNNQNPSMWMQCFNTSETVTADLYMRLYKYNSLSNTYGFIAQGVVSGATVHAGQGFSFNTNFPTVYFGLGDKIYLDTWANVLTNANGDAGLQISLQNRSSSNLGVAGQNAYGGIQFQVGIGQLSETVAETLTDQATVADSISRTIAQTLTDSTPFVDALSSADVTTFTDTYVLTDTSGNTSNPALTDSNTFADAISRTIVETLTDSNTFADTSSHSDQFNGTDHLKGYVATIINDGPMVYYRLDESGGTTAIDQMGNYNATYRNTGVTFSQTGALAGDTDTSVLLDGSAGRITCPSGLPLANLSALSVECWVNLSNTSFSTYPRIVANSYLGGSNKNGFELELGPAPVSGTFYVGNGTSTPGAGMGGSHLVAGQWYHIVGTWDGTNVKLYLNGTQKSTSACSGTIGTPPNNVGIGYNPNYGSDYFPGQIDEVAIYDYALTQAQVTAHYTSGNTFQNDSLALTEVETLTDASALIEASTLVEVETLTDVVLLPTDSANVTETVTLTNYLVQDVYRNTILNDAPFAYYRLGESTGTTAYDISGNNRNGTMHGGITLSQPGAIYGSANTATLFNGSSGYISLPQSGLPAGSSPWSVEAWVYCATLPPTGYHTVVAFGTYTTHEMASLQIHTSGSNTTISLSTYSGDINNGSVAAGKWYHCVGTYDGTSTRLYVNGALASIGNFALNITLAYANIGAGSTGPADYMNGVVDEVAIYPVALSQAQVTAHYNAGTASLFIDQYTLAEFVSLIDQGQFLDTLTAIEVNSQRLLYAQAVCRNGYVTAIGRGN